MAVITSNASGNWSVGATWVGGVKPADNIDSFVIAAGHNVLMNEDQSAWTGLLGGIVNGGVTPGMLYGKNGTSGHLKIKDGYNITGTISTNRGRILGNSDGIWGNTGALAFANKFVIDLQGTAQIQATNLDIALYCTQPTNPFVRTYKTAYTCTNQTTDVNVATDIITFTSAPPVAGTAVRVKSSVTLPGGLSEDQIYYTRTISGNTCKLALQNADAQIVNITSTGSGTLTMYDGHTNTATKTINVIEDVTGDTPWTTTVGHNRIVLCNIGPIGYDQQRDTLATINAGSMVITTNNINSAQYPWARIYLSSRNISIRSAGVSISQGIVLYLSGDTHGGVFQCEIANTYQPGAQTTFFGYGISYGSGHTISGVISGCYYGIYYGSGHTISGVISGCYYGIYYGSGHTVSGVISGCDSGTYYGSGHTISGVISGCSNGISYGSGYTISGVISGCSCGTYYGSGYTISGVISGCYLGISYGSGYTISGVISGCNSGTCSGSGYTISGVISGCSYDFYFPFGKATLKSGGTFGGIFIDRNVVGAFGRLSCEDYGLTHGDHRVFDAFGNILKTACNGSGDAPSQDPDGGNGYCIEASSIQSNCNSINKLLLFEQRIWLTAGLKTNTYKVQTTYAGITAGNLKLTARYVSEDSPLALSEVTNAPAISQRASASDWTQTLAVTLNPNAASWVDLKMELMEYEANNEVYVWPTPVIS